MECSVCGSDSELLYSCGRCGNRLCATHQGRGYHECRPSADGEWAPPGARDSTAGERMVLGPRPEADDGPEVERPAAQLFPGERGVDGESDDPGASGSDRASTARATLPPDADRPGYGPDRLRPDPVDRAKTLSEWFRRQTYVSLALKVGVIAALWNAVVFSTLALGLSVSPL